MKSKFENLDEVVDIVTGVYGTITASCIYAYSSNDYLISYRANEEIKEVWINEDRLALNK